MRRHALVIGAQTAGLQGADNDAVLMREVLQRHGFSVDLRQGPAASRGGILEGYGRLIEIATPQDAIVIYYAGHGGRITLDDHRALPFLVPTDSVCSTAHVAWDAGDFDGLLTFELSLRAAALTQITRNVTIIHDCCFSGESLLGEARVERRPRAVGEIVRPLGVQVKELIDLARASQLEFEPIGLPMVRIFAARTDDVAYETCEQGSWHGVFTRALAAALTSATDDDTWADLIGRLKEADPARLRGVEVSGAIHRRLFSLVERWHPDSGDLVTVERVSGIATRVHGGALHGLHPGDQLEVLSDSEAPAVEATLQITSVEMFESTGTPIPQLRAQARVVLGEVDRLGISVHADDPDLSDRIKAAVAHNRWLKQPGERAALRAVGNVLTAEVDDMTIDEWAPDVAAIADQGLISRAILTLANVARAERLFRRATSSALQVSCVPPGGPRGPTTGLEAARLSVGQRFLIAVRNCAPVQLFAHLFAITPRGGILRLSELAPTGREISPGRVVRFGEVPSLGEIGFGAPWPPGWRGRSARFRLVVVALGEAIDLQPWIVPDPVLPGAFTEGRGVITLPPGTRDVRLGRRARYEIAGCELHVMKE